jgi:class 3 adenylate cyclase/tetratricopeptide (TPR) repeat protein
MAACPSCGESNPAHARFCHACGAALAVEPIAPREMRKTVTIVFCDVIDSTPLGERLDAETFRRVISRYFIEASGVMESHGGTVEKFIGDAVMSVFGIPTVHEDDALRAVRAAAELREALGRLNSELKDEIDIELGIRIGVNTGEVVSGDPTEGQAFATGEAIAVAQRLETAASRGEILMGESTYRLVRDAVLAEPLEPLDLKGLGEKAAWRLLGVVAGAPAFARRLDSPLVGRERELSLLEQAFRRSIDERACHLFTVLGAAGVGKSRLASELLNVLREEANVLIGRCVPYGEGITFWPIRELIRQAASLTTNEGGNEARGRLAELAIPGDSDWDVVVDRLVSVTGLGEGESTNEEAFWAVRRLLESLGHQRPVVVAFDDLHWGEPTFLDLVEHLADWTKNTPVLLLCLARPELLDERPAWAGGKLNATTILLEPLPEADVERLTENLLGSREIADEIRHGLRASGEGNPLFVEEMLSMLIDDGRLEQRNGGWGATGDLQAVEAPPTIQALLAARLDRLGTEERHLLECASVIGKQFSREALAALVPEIEDSNIELSALVRKDLIRPDRHSSGDEAYRFRHILIRDAAYQAVAKERRAALHERFASWLQEARPGREKEFAEILGYHLEQAHRYRAALAPHDSVTRELATRAADLLGAAGKRAIARGDMPAGVHLLTRATLLLRDDEEARLELAPDLGIALIESGELARADGVLANAVEVAARRGDSRLEFRARLEHAAVRVRVDPQVGTANLRQTAEEAIRCFEQLGDEVGLARAWLRLSDVHWMGSRWAERAEALEEALIHARRAGIKRHERWILGTLATSLLFGPTPMSEAIRRCEEMLVNAEHDPVLESRMRNVLSLAKAAMGRFDEGREDYRRSRAALEKLGHKLLPALGTLSGAWLELLAGDLDAAESEIRWGCETLEQAGETASLSSLIGLRGRVLYAQGRYEEAERLTDVLAATAQQEDVHPQAIMRGTRAKLLARRGEIDEAETLAQAGVSLAEQTDELSLQGDAHMDLAEVLRLAGREGEAVQAARAARALFARKEHEVARSQADAWLERAAHP